MDLLCRFAKRHTKTRMKITPTEGVFKKAIPTRDFSFLPARKTIISNKTKIFFFHQYVHVQSVSHFKVIIDSDSESQFIPFDLNTSVQNSKPLS